MRVLITGVTGFAGSHLAEYLLKRGDVEVFGVCRWRSRMDNLADLRSQGKLQFVAEGGNITSVESLGKFLDGRVAPDKLNLVEGDMCDAFSMRRVIGAVKPQLIFHLAAQSYVPGSWNAPADTLNTNIIGQTNIFEAIREAGIEPHIQIAGSSEEYGLVLPDEVPIKETNPLRPLSPYAVSKVAQEMLAWQYYRSYGLKTVVSRGFNHTGPRRGQVFVTSSFARQIAEIEAEMAPPVLFTGDLTSKRDWTDVRDMARAYWLALERGIPGEVYNIGSGSTIEIGEMLEILLSMTTARIDVKQDPARMRPSDVQILWADASKFREQTGWEPAIPFEQTMKDLLDYWRRRVRQS